MYSAFENESEFLVYFKKLYLAYSGKIYNYVLTLSGGNAYLAEDWQAIADAGISTPARSVTCFRA